MLFSGPNYVSLAVFAASVFASTVFAVSSVAEAPFDPMLAEMGAVEYKRYCASCHGTLGHGDGPVADILRRGPSDLTRITARRGERFPFEKIARYIDGSFDVPAHGSRDMPIWGTRFGIDIPEVDIAESVSRGKIATLVEYLKSIQRPLISPD